MNRFHYTMSMSIESIVQQNAGIGISTLLACLAYVWAEDGKKPDPICVLDKKISDWLFCRSISIYVIFELSIQNVMYFV